MKFKKIMLVSVILLAILTVSAVGAADADALAVDDDSGDVIKSSDDGDLIADDDDDDWEDDPYNPDDDDDDEEVEGTGTEIVNMTVEFPKEIAAAKAYTINVTFDKEVTGLLKSSSNTNSYSTDLFGENFTTISFKTCDFGLQTYEIKYFGDDTYAPQTVTGEFTVNSYVIDCADQSVIYGQNLSSYLSVPNGFSSSITLIVDGREYQVSKDEDDEYYFNIAGLKFGDNEVRVICHDETYGDYNGTFTVNAYPWIIIPGEASINGANVYLYLPSDATGTLKVYTADFDDEGEYVKGTLISSSKIKDGYASVLLNNLEWGDNNIYAEYVGDVKYNVAPTGDTISVEPQIIVPEIVFPGKDVYAEIYLPKGTSGTFILSEFVRDDDAEDDVLKEYKATVTNGYAKIILNQLSDGEHNLQAKVVDADGEEIYSVDDDYEVRVITADSIRVYGIEDGDEIVSCDDIEVYLPYELNGTAKIYVDNTFISEISADDDYSYVTLPTLKDGTHKFIVKYFGDEFNLTKEITFKVISCIIDIPDEIDVEYDEIRVDLSENITATMDVYVDGKKLYSQKISGSDNFVDISSVSMGEHKVKIVVTDDVTKKKTTEENTVEFYYSIDIILEDQYNYGGDNEIRVSLPSDITGDLTVTIDGKKRKWTSDGYEIIVNISDVSIGDHEIVVTYSGDKKYPKDYTEDSFGVVGNIAIPDSTSDLISLTLPSNAKGKLILNIYNITGYDDWDEPIKEEYIINKEISLVKGKATFNPKDLPFGNYWVEASYTGSDYYVDDAESEMSADLNVDFPVESFLNNITTIVVDAPDSEKINISIGFVSGIDDEMEDIITPVSSSVLTGKEYSFIPQQLGTYQLKFSYMVNGKVETDEYYVSVVPNELNIPDEIIRNKTNTVSMTLPDDATGNITVAIYTTKLDDEGDEVLVLNRTITSDVINGTGSVELPDDLNYDDYVLEVNYTGNKGNFTKQYSSSFTPYISMPKFIGAGDDIFEFDAEGIDGDIAVSIQGKDATANVVNGKVIVNVPKTISGGRSGGIQITYKDANGVERSISKDLYIKDSVDVNAKSTAIVGNDLIVKVYLSNRFETGNVTAKLNGVEKTADIESGYATFNFGKFAYGNYNVEVTYNGNDRTNAASKNITAKVVYNPVIKASNAKVFYNEGKYSITLKGYDGKIAKNTYVSFKINGKFFKKVKTNSKGVATIKLTKVQVPKTYKITAVALGKSVTKKVTVKRVLTLKAANVKKSAKKLVLTATLKKGKKAIKGKAITFKFNGKKIKTVKTNKKGIAKVTITKATLQKLKAGKKVVYQAIYLKDVVKKTAKVKK